MVIAYHVIFGAYGFWLPNDPRGSWSDFVGAWELLRYGSATKTTETCSLAAWPHDHQLRLAAKMALKRPAVRFNDAQIEVVGRGFGDYAERSGPKIYACAVLRDHVHLVLARYRLKAESLVTQLKGAATRRLMAEGLHPFGGEEKCFARGEWKVFLDTPDDVRRAVRYVELNPSKEGLTAQTWDFVTSYV